MKHHAVSDTEVEEENFKGFATWKIANPWRRAVAQLIDHSLVVLATAVALSFWFDDKIATGHWWTALVTISIYVSTVTQIFFLKLYGNTPGKSMLGLRLLSARPHKGITLFQILQRQFSWWTGIFSLGMTWTTVLSSNDRRAWHDVISETVVVLSRGKADHPRAWEKQAASLWVGFNFVLFLSILMLTMLFQFKAMRSGHMTLSDVGADEFQGLRVSQSPKPNDWRAWFLIAGARWPEPTADDFKSDEDRKLFDFMTAFDQARDLSPGARFDFYRAHMEATENILCRPGSESSVQCQSALAMTQLLTVDTAKKPHPQALLGLQVLEKLENFTDVSHQISYLDEVASKFKEGSLPFASLRAAQAHLLMKSGDFAQANKVMAQTVKSFERYRQNPLLPQPAQLSPEMILAGQLNDSSCQAEAVTDCRFAGAVSCLTDPYWQWWASGCQMKSEPKRVAMSSQALGYWWNAANTRTEKFENLNDWDAIKTRYATQDATPFERDVIAALDLVLNLKSKNPGDLVGLSKNISFENPLWGWAQKNALNEFGSQWAFLIHPAEKKLIARYNLERSNAFGNAASGTMVAKKKGGQGAEGSATEASTGEAGVADDINDSGHRAADSHAPAGHRRNGVHGPRPQEYPE